MPNASSQDTATGSICGYIPPVFVAGRRIAAAAMVVVLLTLGFSAQTMAGVSRTSHATMACTQCHVNGEGASRVNLARPQTELCSSCHQSAARFSHPNIFRPIRPLAAGYPLDPRGEFACSPCHDVHSASSGLVREGKRGRELCQACHTENFFSTMKDQGRSLFASGHLAIGNDIRASGFDGYSANCLTCHTEHGNGPRLGARASGNNHPIGAVYGEAQRRGNYRTVAELPREIALPDGKVGCVSCHSGYSREHGALVVTTDRSRLCFSCHNM